MDEKYFKEALISNDLELMKKVPKGDCHNHVGLGMRFSTFNNWAGGKVTPPPTKMNGIAGLDEYIFNETLKYCDSKEGFEFLLSATIEEAIEDGVKVLEPSIDWSSYLYYENMDEFFKHIKEQVIKYKDKIDFQPELGVARGTTERSWENGVIPCIDGKVFKSIDLYGSEEVNNLKLYKKYFDYARGQKLKIKAHAGEFCDAQQLMETIEVLNPSEIQHGIAAVKSEKAIAMIKERKIRLNICPSSNVILGAVKSIETHPIKELFYRGIDISINTDDLLLFNRSVSEEFLYVYQAGLLGVDELNEIRVNGLREI